MIGQGFFDNRITSLNVFLNNEFKNINWSLSMDQFMQRYQVVHTKSFYKGVRYLSRSNFILKTEKNNSIDTSAFTIRYNSRSISMDALNQEYWVNSDIKFKNGNLYSNIGFIQYEKNSKVNYSIKLKKKISFVDLILEHKRLNKVLHPYYNFALSEIKIPSLYKIISSKIKFLWLSQNMNTFISLGYMVEPSNQILNYYKNLYPHLLPKMKKYRYH